MLPAALSALAAFYCLAIIQALCLS